MAAGAAPAPETKADTKTGVAETSEGQSVTLKQRFERLLHKIFHGREEYAGWRQ
jgi:hypothetical protein